MYSKTATSWATPDWRWVFLISVPLPSQLKVSTHADFSNSEDNTFIIHKHTPYIVIWLGIPGTGYLW